VTPLQKEEQTPKKKRIRPNKRFTQIDAAVKDAQHMVALYQQEVILETTGETLASSVSRKRIKEEEEEEEEVVPEKHPIVVPTAHVADTMLQIENIRDRMDPAKMFQSFVVEAARTQDDIINRIPKIEELLPIMNQVETGGNSSGTWNRVFTSHAISRGLELPVLEVINPEYVSDYLRQPDKLKQWERPCCSPFAKCESVAMGGPVLREFLLPSQAKALLQSPYFCSKGSSATVVLPQQQRSCFLCSQRLTYLLWAKQKTARKNAAPSASSSSFSDQDNKLVHDYIMAVNCPGGYDIRLILPGFTEFIGLAGPVIQHDTRHYAPVKFEPNLRGWIQKDEMLFRSGAMKSQ
jgi:hypothetical protein